MNYMAEVAKIFGVELGERFNIVDNRSGDASKSNYYFSDFGLMVENEEYSAFESSVLVELLKGGYTIKRIPWKPKYQDNYWYVDIRGCICADEWSGNTIPNMYDINLYKLGNCYHTREEAEANKDKWVKFYASDKVLEI